MRVSLAVLSFALAAGSLMASDDKKDFRWMQVQGGITDHRTNNPGAQQPAIGFGMGTWVDKHWGLEASGLFTHVNYGYGNSKEAHALASVLFNPFNTPATFRPFLRLGAGSTTIGSPLSGTGSHTTRLSGTVGLGFQVLLGDQFFASLEGRLVQIESKVTRKEGQALAGIGLRWGKKPRVVVVQAPAPPPVVIETPAPPPQIVYVPTPAPPPVVVYTPAPAPAPVVIPKKIILDEATLHFANGKAILSPEGREAINKVAENLKEIKGPYNLVITGHTSKVGKESFNLWLSKQRAEAVAKVLVDAGIPASDIRTEGLSSSQPRLKEVTKADQAMNRRVEIDIQTKAENVVLHQKQTATVE
ncbi:MAG: OmpA family protein [Holophaga sp.]|nr:OmpA family protein [Holophaga sp.]